MPARRVAAPSGRRRERSTLSAPASTAPEPTAQTVPRERGQTDRQAQEVGRNEQKDRGPKAADRPARLRRRIDDVHRARTVRSRGRQAWPGDLPTDLTGRCDELDQGQVPRARRVSKGVKGVASLLVSQQHGHLSHELPLKRMANARVQAPTHSTTLALGLQQGWTASDDLSESEAIMCESTDLDSLGADSSRAARIARRRRLVRCRRRQRAREQAKEGTLLLGVALGLLGRPIGRRLDRRRQDAGRYARCDDAVVEVIDA